MIRAIIFAVFVVPIISLVLDKTQKATKKEKFTNTVFVSHAYQTVCHICSLIMVGIAIALGLFMGFDNTVGHSVVFAIFVLLIETIRHPKLANFLNIFLLIGIIGLLINYQDYYFYSLSLHLRFFIFI